MNVLPFFDTPPSVQLHLKIFFNSPKRHHKLCTHISIFWNTVRRGRRGGCCQDRWGHRQDWPQNLILGQAFCCCQKFRIVLEFWPSTGDYLAFGQKGENFLSEIIEITYCPSSSIHPIVISPQRLMFQFVSRHNHFVPDGQKSRNV